MKSKVMKIKRNRLRKSIIHFMVKLGPVFPLEVLDHIIGFLWDDPGALFACMRTCRQLLPRSLRYLHSYIRITSDRSLSLFIKACTTPAVTSALYEAHTLVIGNQKLPGLSPPPSPPPSLPPSPSPPPPPLRASALSPRKLPPSLLRRKFRIPLELSSSPLRRKFRFPLELSSSLLRPKVRFPLELSSSPLRHKLRPPLELSPPRPPSPELSPPPLPLPEMSLPHFPSRWPWRALLYASSRCQNVTALYFHGLDLSHDLPSLEVITYSCMQLASATHLYVEDCLVLDGSAGLRRLICALPALSYVIYADSKRTAGDRSSSSIRKSKLWTPLLEEQMQEFASVFSKKDTTGIVDLAQSTSLMNMELHCTSPSQIAVVLRALPPHCRIRSLLLGTESYDNASSQLLLRELNTPPFTTLQDLHIGLLGPFVCKTCLKSFAREGELSRHLRHTYHEIMDSDWSVPPTPPSTPIMSPVASPHEQH